MHVGREQARQTARTEEREREREKKIIQLKRELTSANKELKAYRLKDTRSALEKAVSGAPPFFLSSTEYIID